MCTVLSPTTYWRLVGISIGWGGVKVGAWVPEVSCGPPCPCCAQITFSWKRESASLFQDPNLLTCYSRLKLMQEVTVAFTTDQVLSVASPNL